MKEKIEGVGIIRGRRLFGERGGQGRRVEELSSGADELAKGGASCEEIQERIGGCREWRRDEAAG